MVNGKLKNLLMSGYIVFILTTVGFAGVLVVEEILDFGSVDAATTRYVGPGQTYATITAALSASKPGDTIRVYSGTYRENFYINTSVSIIGNGSKNTIIDNKGFNNIITINSNWVFLSDFRISNGNNDGIYINWNLNNLTFKNLTISNNRDCGIYGGSLADLTITNCKILNNFDDGIRIYSPRRAIIIGNNLTSNSDSQI